MNVQDKQQGQTRPSDTPADDAGIQAGGSARPEPATPGTSRAEKAATLAADVERAMYLAAEIAGVNVRVLTSHNRWERPCMMRQIAAYWLYKVRQYTQREIGSVFCRDRSSIYHAVNRIGELLTIGDKQTTELWQEFSTRITDYKPIKITKRMGVLHDLEGMPEWQKKREYLARLLTNLTFEVADVLETLWIECEERNAECGYQMRQEEKRHFKAAKYHLKAFRGATRALDTEQQESFGNDAEMLLDLIYAAVTRTGTDDSIMIGFLEHIMQMPDRVGLDGVRRGGTEFERIKMEQAKARIEAKTK